MPSRLDQIRAQLTSSAPSPTLGSDVAYVLKLVDELAGAVKNYLGEYDTPVPDYTLRNQYRRQLQAILAKLKEPGDD